MSNDKNKELSRYTREQKLAELWRRGILHFKLHAAQKLIYDAIKNSTSKKFVINSSRRLGKSYALCLIAQEAARQNPNTQIRFAAPTQRQVRKIIIPLMRQIQEDCPKNLRPKFRSMDGVFEFHNGSEIHIAGSELGQADALRGTACDLGIVDEAGFATDLEYLVESILMPQTLTRPNARIILSSTPPESPDHPFTRYAEQAIAQGSYAKFTIHSNPMLTPEQIHEYMLEAGGENSTTWRREYLAEFVQDRETAIFPEATDQLMNEIVIPVERPLFFIPFTVIDLGYVDYTGCTFGYYHFELGKAVIEDELMINREHSGVIVEEIRKKEAELWGTNVPKDRICDGNALAIADMCGIHNFYCRAPEKSDLEANVNRARNHLVNRATLIHPRCKNLISQIKFGSWDGNHRKFARSVGGGHQDVLASYIYFEKHLDRYTNPIPPGYGYNKYDHFGFPRSNPNDLSEQIKKLFPFMTRK